MLKLPQRDSDAGISVLFTHEPLAKVKKSLQASTERSIRDVSNALVCARPSEHIEIITAQAVMRRKNLLCICAPKMLVWILRAKTKKVITLHHRNKTFLYPVMQFRRK